MNIKINGMSATLEGVITLSELVEINLKGKEPKGVAVAINENIIPRSKWDEFVVSDNDSIEIVQAVQGG